MTGGAPSDLDDAPSSHTPLITFSPARRKGLPVLMSLYSFSGGGKTLSALYIARGLVGPKGRIAMLDTEFGRGLVYSNDAELCAATDPSVEPYDHAELTPPYTPERYIQAIDAAERAGYGALIIDSGSAEWDNIGGVLELAEKGGGKGLQKWANPKARHKKLVRRVTTSRMHVIICFRAKEKLAPGKDKDGKDAIVSQGMVPIAEKTFIYETTAQIYIPVPKPTEDQNRRGYPVIEKCPKDLLPAFDPQVQISVKTGELIRRWIEGGEAVDRGAEDVKRRGEEAAEGGYDALRAWYRGLSREQQDGLTQVQLNNLRDAAREADKQRKLQKDAEEEVEREETETANRRGPATREVPADERPPPKQQRMEMGNGAAAPTLSADEIVLRMEACTTADEIKQYWADSAPARRNLPPPEQTALSNKRLALMLNLDKDRL